MKDSMTALCLSLESGLAELVNSQDDWRLCALLSAARQGVAGVRRRAQDEAAGEDACRVAGEALGGEVEGDLIGAQLVVARRCPLYWGENEYQCVRPDRHAGPHDYATIGKVPPPPYVGMPPAPCHCGSPCPPGLAMCVECQAREGRE